VQGKIIVNFLGSYQTHEGNRKVRTGLLAEYVQKQSDRGELNSWSVALIAKDSPSAASFGGVDLQVIQRTLRTGLISDGSDRLRIQRLLSGRDEAIDFDSKDWEAALELTRKEWQGDPGRGQDEKAPDEPGGKQLRSIRPPERGLLLLYPLALRDSAGQELEYIVLGMGVSFPDSSSAPRVAYHVNGLYYEQEYGPEE